MKKLSQGLAVLGCIFFLFAMSASAETISMKAPHFSDDGSFVLRVESALSTYESSKQGMHLEIYRNKDGGEYQRILRGPHFAALSELVRENGLYGYKARWVASDAAGEGAQLFSEPVYIEVTTKVPRMVKPRSDRIASNTSPAGIGVY
jgi:hypothetical protein